MKLLKFILKIYYCLFYNVNFFINLFYYIFFILILLILSDIYINFATVILLFLIIFFLAYGYLMVYIINDFIDDNILIKNKRNKFNGKKNKSRWCYLINLGVVFLIGLFLCFYNFYYAKIYLLYLISLVFITIIHSFFYKFKFITIFFQRFIRFGALSILLYFIFGKKIFMLSLVLWPILILYSYYYYIYYKFGKYRYLYLGTLVYIIYYFSLFLIFNSKFNYSYYGIFFGRLISMLCFYLVVKNLIICIFYFVIRNRVIFKKFGNIIYEIFSILSDILFFILILLFYLTN